jgi:hypothetical protein
MCGNVVGISGWGTTKFFDDVQADAQRRIRRECASCALKRVGDGIDVNVDACITVTMVRRSAHKVVQLYGEPTDPQGIEILSVEAATCVVNDGGVDMEWKIRAGTASRAAEPSKAASP